MRTAICFFLLIISNRLFSQDMQVPFDNKGVITIINKDWNDKIKSFPQKNFKEALIFKLSDTLFSLEVITKENNLIFRDRKIINLEQYKALKLNYDQYISTNANAIEYPNEGRVKLIVSNTITGLAFYGWAIPEAFEVTDFRASLGIYMLTAGLSFYLPFALTNKSNISYAEATAWHYGQTRGIAHFASIPLIGNENPNYKASLALGITGSLIEAFSFYSITKNYNLNVGQVHAIATYADFGLFNGLLFSEYSGLIKPATWDEAKGQEIVGKHSIIPIGIIAGSAIGYASGYFLSKDNRYSTGDAYTTYASGLLGAYIAYSVDFIADANSRITAGSVAFGSIAGLAGGHILSARINFTQSQGALTFIGTAAGGLFGLGCGYLVTENTNAWMISSAVAATGSFALMNYLFMEKNQTRKFTFVPDINFKPMYVYQPNLNPKMVPALSLSIKF